MDAFAGGQVMLGGNMEELSVPLRQRGVRQSLQRRR
jgi:hypothetical protein